MSTTTPRQPLRLAILETDTPQPQTNAAYGGYGGVFTALLTAAAGSAVALADQLSITAYHVVGAGPEAYPPLDDVDALLITGSRHSAFHDDAWIQELVRYTRKAVDSDRVKVVGVCFGHQIVGRAMDAPVGRNPKGWEVAVTDFDLTAKGKEVFQLGDGEDKLRLQQMHADIVQSVPSGAALLGSNAACEVQGFYAPGRYLTVQGHPEFNEEIITEILRNRHAAGIFPDDVFADAITRAPVRHDGVAVGRAFLRFFFKG
ncbi:hypothetical protein S40285_02863 [Stachybotrys chlorohalonatus IBT 40285]|uniref:Glutamine amidotransferase domain-containing protein n=1 Tax=Stachybotrys chlorohalonatus (strain IBT 40285) TaxID=1283841 RepID=A0A084QLP2_STAC4|nr:hypothetical protein S40285_02863 [Stachybotrys chlorohalonata IBT 40285]